MKALIDLDPIVYQYSDLKFPDGRTMPGYIAEEYALRKIESICENAGASSWVGYLTYGPDNFRNTLATIKPYKGNRADREKPPLYEHIRGWLCDFTNVHMVFGMEADDALSIEQWESISSAKRRYQIYTEDDPIEEEHLGYSVWENGWLFDTVICTLDKDLDMVPGWHYRWSKGNVEEIEPWFQTELGGLKCFYKQCLLGDTVDNIHGLYGVGPKSSYISKIEEMDSEEAIFDLVMSLYRKWYGSYAEQFLLEVGNLLWMKRTVKDSWEFPGGYNANI